LRCELGDLELLGGQLVAGGAVAPAAGLPGRPQFPAGLVTPGGPLCPSPGGCTVVTANTVYDNQVMGLYVRAGVTLGSYLATIPHHGADGRES
jgi:hypothetical protein